MQYINRMTVSVAVVTTGLLCAVFAFTAQSALAKQPPKLNGTYGVTGAGGCMQSNNGFNADLTAITPGVSYTAQTMTGTFTFNGDGTGTRSGATVALSVPPTTQPSASQTTFNGAFTYTVDADGTIHYQTSTPTTGEATQGPRTGQTYSVDEIALVGKVSKDGSTIVLSTEEAGVETISWSNGDTSERICNRSRVLTEL